MWWVVRGPPPPSLTCGLETGLELPFGCVLACRERGRQCKGRHARRGRHPVSHISKRGSVGKATLDDLATAQLYLLGAEEAACHIEAARGEGERGCAWLAYRDCASTSFASRWECASTAIHRRCVVLCEALACWFALPPHPQPVLALSRFLSPLPS